MDDVNAPAATATPRYLAMLESDRADWWQSKNFDKWKSHYISEYPRGEFILERLRRYAPDFEVVGARILDVGCGDAGVPIAFAEAGAEAVGIEPFGRSVERGSVRAEEHGVDVELHEGFAESLPFPEASFDLVVLDNVLEHVNDRDRTLVEIRRVLRPGGLLYLVTPKPFALYSLWSDPHYAMAGLVLLPRPLQQCYFERVRGGGKGNYGVGHIPTRRWVLGRLRRYHFTLLVPPRDVWVDYVRAKILRPAEISTGLKRRAAAWVERHPGATDGPVARWLWDIGMGSNFFIARRD